MIKLIQGDCLDYLKNIIEEVNNPVIVTDPPFNINYCYNEYKDNKQEEDYLIWLSKIFSYCPFVVIHYPPDLHKISNYMNKIPTKIATWVYNSNSMKQHRDIAFYDIVPNFRLVEQPYRNYKDNHVKEMLKKGKTGTRLYDFWEHPQINNSYKKKHNITHPCVMPLKIMENVCGIIPEEYTIIDPFMGSGTTGMACKKLNRDFVGIELNKEYFELAKNRINNVQTNLNNFIEC